MNAQIEGPFGPLWTCPVTENSSAWPATWGHLVACGHDESTFVPVFA